MKKLLLLFLCLLLLTSCSNTEVAVAPQQIQNTPPSVTSSDLTTPATDEKQETQEAPSPVEKNDAPARPQKQSASVVVYGLEGEVIFSADKEIYDGMTAFDILLDCAKEKNIPVAYSGSKSSAYVTSIGGLAEKQHGGMSGWIYTLNGESIMLPSGKCVLSPDDKVEWKYITEF